MTIHPLEIHHAMELCEWRYDSPYHIYNWPSWDQMKQDEIEFGDPVLRKLQYHSVLDRTGRLIGFAQLFPMVRVTRLGMGLRPDMCGAGLGSALARLVAEEALRRQPMNEIDLEVLAWNSRAIKAYERAGFIIADTYSLHTHEGPKDCYCMVYKPM